MARTPVTAAALEAYLRWLIHPDVCESDRVSHLVPILSHDKHNQPVASVETHHAGRCLRIEAFDLRVVRCLAWEHGAPAGPDGQRGIKRSYAGGHSKGKAGVDLDGVRGWLDWLSGGSEP